MHFSALHNPKEKTITHTVATPSLLNFSFFFPIFFFRDLYQQLLLTGFHLEKKAKKQLLAQLMLRTGARVSNLHNKQLPTDKVLIYV